MNLEESKEKLFKTKQIELKFKDYQSSNSDNSDESSDTD